MLSLFSMKFAGKLSMLVNVDGESNHEPISVYTNYQGAFHWVFPASGEIY